MSINHQGGWDNVGRTAKEAAMYGSPIALSIMLESNSESFPSHISEHLGSVTAATFLGVLCCVAASNLIERFQAAKGRVARVLAATALGGMVSLGVNASFETQQGAEHIGQPILRTIDTVDPSERQLSGKRPDDVDMAVGTVTGTILSGGLALMQTSRRRDHEE